MAFGEVVFAFGLGLGEFPVWVCEFGSAEVIEPVDAVFVLYGLGAVSPFVGPDPVCVFAVCWVVCDFVFVGDGIVCEFFDCFVVFVCPETFL